MNAHDDADHDGGLDFRFALGRAQIALARGDVGAAWAATQQCVGLVDPADPKRGRPLRFMFRNVGTAWLRELVASGNWTEAIEVAETVITQSQGEAGDEAYQLLTDALMLAGADAAYNYHQLSLVSSTCPTIAPGELVCCLVVRDGMWRIDQYLDTLRAQGVEQFFAIDNGSSDGTAELLSRQPDVTLWSTPARFSNANSGAAWFDLILRHHALGAWVLILDLDEEIRVAEDPNLADLCRTLDDHGLKALTGFHVDLYQRSDDDPTLYYDRVVEGSDFSIDLFPEHIGSMISVRNRVFGQVVVGNKAPLQLFEAGLRLCLGQHFSYHPAEATAQSACAVLHYKFTTGFTARATTIRDNASVHPTWRDQHRAYASSAITSLFSDELSVPLGSTEALINNGALQRLAHLA